MVSTSVLSFQRVHKRFFVGFRRKAVQALDTVTFAVPDGSVTALLGPNGAGKSTALALAVGLLHPDRGDVHIYDAPPGRTPVGYLPEAFRGPPAMTPVRLVSWMARLRGVTPSAARSRAAEALERVGLTRRHWGRPVGKLSRGMQQRVGMAQAIVGMPGLVLLDEPMAGLSPEGRALFHRIVSEERARGATQVLSTHVLDDAQRLCDHVVILRKGRVKVAGALDGLLGPLGTVIVRLQEFPETLRPSLQRLGGKAALHGALWEVTVPSSSRTALLDALRVAGVSPLQVEDQPATLRDLYDAHRPPGEGAAA